MAKLPVISARECIVALEKAGFHIMRQAGSHITLHHDGTGARVTVPNHRELKKGMLRAIIRQAEMTVEEFVDLL